MADRSRARSRSRSPVGRRKSQDGIQERLKKISGLENGSVVKKNGVENLPKIDREKVSFCLNSYNFGLAFCVHF